MELFCFNIRKDSVSSLRFPFLSRVKVFSCEMSLVCRLQRSYSYLPSRFYVLVIIVLVKLVIYELFLVAVISFIFIGGSRGVMVIVVGNVHGNTSSNRGRDCLHLI